MAAWLLLVVVLLGGCATKERIEAAPKVLPQWYTSPPSADAHSLYAVGEGESREAAIADALGQMRSMLGVRIETRFERVARERQGSVSDYQKETHAKLSSVATSLMIAHYEVLEVHEHAFRSVMVLLRSKRADLIKGFALEIEASLEALEQTMQTSTLEALLALKAQQKAFEAHFADQLTALATLQANEAAQQYQERYRTLHAQITRFKERFSFALKSQDAPLLGVLRSALSQEGYRIASSDDCHTIQIESNYERTQAYGFYIIRARIELRTLDADAKLKRANTVVLIAQNPQSEGSAMQEIVRKLSQKIEAEGIETLLGWR